MRRVEERVRREEARRGWDRRHATCSMRGGQACIMRHACAAYGCPAHTVNMLCCMQAGWHAGE